MRIIQAWREEPARAAALVRRHRPNAKFIVMGHTHRPGFWRMPGGLTVINTGSFCRPLGSFAVDVSSTHLVIRRVDAARGEFRAGSVVAEFALADAKYGASLRKFLVQLLNEPHP